VRKPVTAGLATNDPVRGGTSARVTMHEWADFECPFCGRAEETVGKVLKEYGPRVRLVWHDLPLPMHPDAPLAARAGREAFQQKGSAGFWALHDLMMSDQHKLARADLDLYARALGFDLNRWNSALDQGLHQTEIDAEKLVADGMDINGTPAFVIVPAGAASGYFISGAQPYEKFHKLLERALVEAR
jgi:protein-disulfide isomerase